MRATKKVVKVEKVVVYYYDRELKEENTKTIELLDGDNDLKLESNHILIESKVIETREVTMVLTGENFLKYATIQE